MTMYEQLLSFAGQKKIWAGVQSPNPFRTWTGTGKFTPVYGKNSYGLSDQPIWKRKNGNDSKY